MPTPLNNPWDDVLPPLDETSDGLDGEDEILEDTLDYDDPPDSNDTGWLDSIDFEDTGW